MCILINGTVTQLVFVLYFNRSVYVLMPLCTTKLSFGRNTVGETAKESELCDVKRYYLMNY